MISPVHDRYSSSWCGHQTGKGRSAAKYAKKKERKKESTLRRETGLRDNGDGCHNYHFNARNRAKSDHGGYSFVSSRARLNAHTAVEPQGLIGTSANLTCKLYSPLLLTLYSALYSPPPA